VERFGDEVQPRRIGDRQRTEHHRVHRAENRRRPADAERERDDRDGREGPMLQELPTRKHDVLNELAHVFRSLHVVIPPSAQRAERRAHPLDVAEAALGFASRRVGVHAGRDQIARPHLDVERDLVAHFLADVFLPGTPVKAATNRAALSKSPPRTAPTRRLAPRAAAGRAASADRTSRAGRARRCPTRPRSTPSLHAVERPFFDADAAAGRRFDALRGSALVKVCLRTNRPEESR
jgi:hypothetical protein